MNFPTITQEEAARLYALHALNILDTPQEARFDRIVDFAATAFDVPIAVISLVDKDRQWFKAKTGMDSCGSDRGASICSHAIQSPEVFVIEDLTQDPLFSNNPFVTQPPHVRSYAGAPLILSNGKAVGTLCLMDTSPRRFDRLTLVMLRSLADVTVAEMTSEPADPG